MRPYHREQLVSLIQQELGEIIAKEIEPPSGALLTISEVELSKDLKTAIVWVSVIPSEKSEETLGILTRARGFLRHLLGEGIKMRAIPRIEFSLDHGPEHAARIEKISLEKDKR